MKLSDLNKQLWAQHDYWKPHWRDIQELMLPYRGRLDDDATQNNGKEKADKRFDGTSTRALRVLSAGMHGGLTSPSAKWFRLGLRDTDLSKFGPVRMWLDSVETVVYAELRKSNFYQAVQNVYLESGGFGSSCLFSEAHSSGSGLWFRLITIGDFCLATDSQGRVNTVFRRDWLTAQQLEAQFGKEALSQNVKNLLQQTPHKYVKIIHAVQPRQTRDVNKIDSQNLPFESVYFEANEQELTLREGGFESFPFLCPRWDVIGSNVYGYSPGMDALPDVRSMNAITADLLTAVEKEVNPPVNVPDGLWDDVDLLPGGRNPGSATEKVTPTYQISPNLGAGAALKQEYKSDIGDWFYTPLFVLSANPNATATEIARKNEEQLVQLGPVIQRMFNELLNPVIERSFSILFKQGLIPEPPPEIQGQEIQIEYISSLAQAQKLVGINKLERFVGFAGGMSEVDQSVLDNVDMDAVITEHANGMGVPAKILRSQQEVEQIRQQRAEAQQQALLQEQAMAEAQTAATLSNAKMDDKNALTEMADAAQ